MAWEYLGDGPNWKKQPCVRLREIDNGPGTGFMCEIRFNEVFLARFEVHDSICIFKNELAKKLSFKVPLDEQDQDHSLRLEKVQRKNERQLAVLTLPGSFAVFCNNQIFEASLVLGTDIIEVQLHDRESFISGVTRGNNARVSDNEKPSHQEQRGAIALSWHRWSRNGIGWVCLDCGEVATMERGGFKPCQECGARSEKEYAFGLCEQCESKYHFLCRDKPRSAQEVASIKLSLAKRLIEEKDPFHDARRILEELVRSYPKVAEEAAELLRNVPLPIEEPPKERKERRGQAKQPAFEKEIKTMRAEIEELRAEIKKGQTQ